MEWSAGSASNTSSSLSDMDMQYIAAKVRAGAVFLPVGSKIIFAGLQFISLRWSDTKNLCSSLQSTIGLIKLGIFSNLSIVSCRKEYFFSMLRNGFGYLSRERGHSLLPEPLARMIGLIFMINSEIGPFWRWASDWFPAITVWNQHQSNYSCHLTLGSID